MTQNGNLAVFAALNGFVAVMIGTFAAHGAGPAVKTLFTTGAHYQIVHALLALICAIWPLQDRLVKLAGWLAGAGGLIFCLAMIVTSRNPSAGIVAPIGGVLMIAAWLLLAFAALRNPPSRA